jgi:hypothetical protein
MIDDYWDGEKDGPFSVCVLKKKLGGFKYSWDWIGDFETLSEAEDEAHDMEEAGFESCIQNEAGNEVYRTPL